MNPFPTVAPRSSPPTPPPLPAPQEVVSEEADTFWCDLWFDVMAGAGDSKHRSAGVRLMTTAEADQRPREMARAVSSRWQRDVLAEMEFRLSRGVPPSGDDLR